MKILIAGASGFIGSELVRVLNTQHQISVLGRDKKRLDASVPAEIEKLTWDKLHSCDAKQFDVIINLCGSNIGNKRWTQSVKKELVESRTLTNKLLINWLINQKAKPRYFCANAIGIYGAYNEGSLSFDEDSIIDTENMDVDFLKQIAISWQQSLQPAIANGIKVTTLRFGVVLKKGKGMLQKLELPFLLGLGSIFGKGQQEISWIHYADAINAIIFLLNQPSLIGPINITSPHPVTQKTFANQFSNALHRPCFLRVPAFVIKAIFGEMGDYLILKGQSVYPKKLLELHFEFKYPSLADALKYEYQ